MASLRWAIVESFVIASVDGKVEFISNCRVAVCAAALCPPNRSIFMVHRGKPVFPNVMPFFVIRNYSHDSKNDDESECTRTHYQWVVPRNDVEG